MSSDTSIRNDIQTVLQSGKVHVLFQPVVSVERRTIIGFEAFARGGGDHGAEVVKPKVLFDPGLDPDTQLAVDRLCRESALGRFRAIAEKHQGVLLFLNVHGLSLRSANTRAGYLGEQVARHGIEPSRVVIEIAEEHLTEGAPFELVDRYRDQGFRFSIDGGGYSAATPGYLKRIMPHFYKTAGLEGEGPELRFRSELLHSLAETVERVGCRLVGKGVEQESDAFTLLEAGVYLQQGFFYTKSDSEDQKDALAVFRQKIQEVHQRYREARAETIKAKRLAFETLHKTAARVSRRFEASPREDFPQLCQTLVQESPEAFSIFVLDERGLEIARCWDDAAGYMDARLSPDRDHSIRDYYLHLRTGFDKFVTHPFVSPVTKAPHCILALRFYNREGDEFVLGLEFRSPTPT